VRATTRPAVVAAGHPGRPVSPCRITPHTVVV
jgi:hypothetical protein